MHLSGVMVTCPYCWESIEVEVDASALPATYVEDCSVCCRPILLRASMDAGGEVLVDATQEND
jgi:hypothetical protein